MELWATIKKDWLLITIWVIVLLLLILSFVNINWEKPKFKEGYNWIWYSILIVIGIFSFITTYHYLKYPNLENDNKFVLEFLKVLLPTLLAILSLLYALSSGLFNIKNETLKKNKANLEYDINRLQEDKKGFENEKEKLAKKLKTLNDSLNFKEEILNSKEKEITEKEKEIQSFKTTVEEIKKESLEKSNAIDYLRELNKQFKLQSEKRISNINKPIVELVDVISSEGSGYVVSVFDSKLNQLTQKEIGFLNSDEYGSLARYDKESKKFYVSLAPYIGAPDGIKPNKPFNLQIFRTNDVSLGGKLQFNWDTLNRNDLDTSSSWSILVPYIYAEYKIILNDF